MLIPIITSLLAFAALLAPAIADFVDNPPTCATPKSYIAYHNKPHKKYYKEIELGASLPGDCCRRCAEVENCMFGHYYYRPDRIGICVVTVNTQVFEGAETDKYCPLGISTEGEAQDEKDSWDGGDWVLGPCWRPSIVDEFDDLLEIEGF